MEEATSSKTLELVQHSAQRYILGVNAHNTWSCKNHKSPVFNNRHDTHICTSDFNVVLAKKL